MKKSPRRNSSAKPSADNAQRDLDEAIPALEAAMEALDALNKKDITEIKSFTKPPPLVETVLQAVMILRGQDPTWAEAKRQLGNTNFIDQLKSFDKDNMSDRTLKKIAGYCANAEFQPDIIGKVSSAARSLCMWVRAMEVYGRIFRVVEPKRRRLHEAESLLQEKQATLKVAQDKLAKVEELMQNLQNQYADRLDQKAKLQQQAEDTALKLDQ